MPTTRLLETPIRERAIPLGYSLRSNPAKPCISSEISGTDVHGRYGNWATEERVSQFSLLSDRNDNIDVAILCDGGLVAERGRDGYAAH